MHPHRADGILVHSLELRVVLALAAQVHLSEHVDRRLLAPLSARALALGFERAGDGPARGVAVEAVRLTVLCGRQLA